jgi:hypothetical protein
MTKYTMTPIANGTRLRTDHNTFATIIDVNPNLIGVQSFDQGTLLEGTELWTAPADGNEVKKNDKWLYVVKANGVTLAVPGWTAYIHKGQPICNNFKEITDPTIPPAPIFPQSFTLVNPDGSKAEYIFVRIIE